MIPLYVVNASGASVLTLDDPSVDKDQGSDFTAQFVSAALIPQPASGESKLRRLTQCVAITTSATVALTPIVDSAESSDDTQSTSFSSVNDGQSPVALAATNNTGGRFQMRCAVTSHVGKTELSQSEMWLVPRRSTK